MDCENKIELIKLVLEWIVLIFILINIRKWILYIIIKDRLESLCVVLWYVLFDYIDIKCW